MKNLSIYLLSSILLILLACASSSSLPKADVAALLKSGEFTFMAERAQPTNYDVINIINSLPAASSAQMLNLDYGYTIQLTGSEVKVELPYFGRMYSPSYDPSKNSFRFTSKDFVLNKTDGKKGSIIYNIAPKDQPNIQRIMMQIYPQGRASVSITANDRQSIFYEGYIMANEPAKK